MANDIFDDIGFISSARGKRNFIRYNISEDVWSTESANSILDALKSVGYGIRRQDFLGIRREVLREIEVRELFRTLQPDQLVPHGWMTEKKDINMAMQAQYRLAMTVVDPSTGHRELVFRSIASDYQYTKQEIEDFADELFAMGGEGYEFLIEGISLREVWLQPGGKLWR